jgi:hypothetical protein
MVVTVQSYPALFPMSKFFTQPYYVEKWRGVQGCLHMHPVIFFILTISVNIGVCEYDLVSRGCGVVII